MSTQDCKDMSPTEKERHERVIDAIALAATGAFDEALGYLTIAEDDTFGVIEESLRMFINELATAHRRAAQALDALEASKHELEEKLGTIERQQAAIQELSVPIIDVWEGIFTLPLFGLMDGARAVHVTEKLLERMTDANIRWVIIDLTGVAEVDAMTVQHLKRLVEAVRLLGGRCILTGIRAQMAMTFVTMGISLEELTPMRSLREALKYCIQRGAQDLRGG